MSGIAERSGNQASENFVSEQDASYYAQLYEEQGITGGHVILLNKEGTEFYEETKRQALLALSTYRAACRWEAALMRRMRASF